MFGPISNSFVDIYLFIYLLGSVLIHLVFLALLVYYIRCEIRDQYVDFITISQYLLLAIHLELFNVISVMLLFDEIGGLDYMNAIGST